MHSKLYSQDYLICWAKMTKVQFQDASLLVQFLHKQVLDNYYPYITISQSMAQTLAQTFSSQHSLVFHGIASKMPWVTQKKVRYKAKGQLQKMAKMG